jgi:hypothetical protein
LIDQLPLEVSCYRILLSASNDHFADPPNLFVLQQAYDVCKSTPKFGAGLFKIVLDGLELRPTSALVVNTHIPFSLWFELHNILIFLFTRLLVILHLAAFHLKFDFYALYFGAIQRMRPSAEVLKECSAIICQQISDGLSLTGLFEIGFRPIFVFDRMKSAIAILFSGPALSILLSRLVCCRTRASTKCRRFSSMLWIISLQNSGFSMQSLFSFPDFRRPIRFENYLLFGLILCFEFVIKLFPQRATVHQIVLSFRLAEFRGRYLVCAC